MTSWPRKGEGGRQKVTLSSTYSYVVKRVTREREGVKNDEKSSDVVCERPLIKSNQAYSKI